MKILRIIKYLVLLVLAVALVVVSMANRDPVTLQLLPEELASFVGYNQSIELPRFLLILGGVAVGLLIGFIWEWLREYRYRAEAARARAEARRLAEQLPASARKSRSEADDVLAVLDGGSKRPGLPAR